ncbi:MAG: AMP-binding protein [Bacteroidales bacterium]|nr:AMP-binding protein [Bacteroidales bacterium]
MKTIAFFYRVLLASRYRIEIEGENLLRDKQAKLFLPNHQAHVDAQILTSYILKHSTFVPVISARLFKVPIVKGIFRRLKAIPVSNIQSGKVDKDVVNKLVSSTKELLESGNNVLIYPSGQLAGQGFEKIFNKPAAYQVVNNMPDKARIIGVRTSGLWGSMWSKAWTGDIPPILNNLLKSVFIILANLFVFVPKRKVHIHFEDITEQAREAVKEGKINFNAFLEKFYNQHPEEVNYLKHYFFLPKSNRKLPGRIAGSLKEFKVTSAINPRDIPADIFNGVKEVIGHDVVLDGKDIKISTNLVLELGIDSLGMVNLVSAIENRFKCQFTGNFALIKTVGDLCRIAQNIKETEEVLKPSYLKISKEDKRCIDVVPTKTILDNFILSCTRNKNESLAYDKMMGTNTRKDFLLKAIVVSGLIKKHVQEEYVAIMLPALESTALLIASTYMAGKIPVMLNWTAGKKTVMDCMKTVAVKKVITATAFYEKVEEKLPEGFKEHCLFFDKEIKKVSIGSKLAALTKSFFPKTLFLGKKLNDIAVILFTSGSEAKPKAVPLTHTNIMYNLKGVLSDLEIYNHDILIGFLPPFHSFGFTVLSVLPIVTAVKVAYTPDPTDAREIAKIISHTKASVLLATPTFLKMIMSASSDEDFNSIRLTITGAESLHPDIAQQFRRKTHDIATLLQGYGITECSPILSLTTPETEDLKSVGKMITGVECLIIDLDTNKPLPDGNEGMIVVHGKSIFNGYLDKNIESPFITIDGKRYYKTGDLGYIDPVGDLFITGRLKRFIKVAGEMISLPAIESILLEKFGSPDELVLAVEGFEDHDKATIVLFTIKEISVEEANACLRKSGLSNMMKINEVQMIDEIPILGSGKTDYKQLRNRAGELLAH